MLALMLLLFGSFSEHHTSSICRAMPSASVPAIGVMHWLGTALLLLLLLLMWLWL